MKKFIVGAIFIVTAVILNYATNTFWLGWIIAFILYFIIFSIWNSIQNKLQAEENKIRNELKIEIILEYFGNKRKIKDLAISYKVNKKIIEKWIGNISKRAEYFFSDSLPKSKKNPTF